MKCQAKINHHWGSKSKCSCEATKQITIETFAPHLQANVRKVRSLCNEHASRLLKTHRYQIKRLGKKTTLNVINIQSHRPLGIAAILLLCSVACSVPKKIANYKVTPNGYVIWRYTKVGEPKKDILSTGDTLVTTADSIYVVRKQ